MAFKDIVESAKRVPDIDFRRGIRAATAVFESAEVQQEAPSQTEPGINAIAQQLTGEKSAAMGNAKPPSAPAKSWTACKFMRKGDRMNLCTQFFSKCAEEKCQRKFLE